MTTSSVAILNHGPADLGIPRVRRSADWYKATSRAKGSYRTLGDLVSDRNGVAVAGPHREGEEPKPMMNGPEKSDPAIVAMKPANKAEGPFAVRPAKKKHAAESVERRAGTKGNADHRSTYRTQSRTG